MVATVFARSKRDAHQCSFGILPRIIGLGYHKTEAYHDTVTFL